MAKDKKIDKKNKKNRIFGFLKIIGFFLLSIFLYFWSIGILRSFIEYIKKDDSLMGFPKPFFYIICAFGIGSFFVAIFFKRFSKHYLYCHELTHALFGLLTGSKVSKLKINEDSASVNVSHPNLIVVLAPYIISLHVLLILFFYGCTVIAFPNCGNIIHNFFAILIGLATSFHFIFTIISLTREQTDIKRSGYFISYLLITTLNLAGMMTIITCVDTISLKYFFENSIFYMLDTIEKISIAIFL